MLWSLCWRRCLRCASDALSASPFPCCRRLFRSRWILVGVLQRSFDGKSSPARIPCNVLRLLFCVICTEVARDSPIVNFPGNTKCSMTSLAENQAIYSKKERKMGHPILQLPKTTRGSRAGIINSLRRGPRPLDSWELNTHLQRGMTPNLVEDIQWILKQKIVVFLFGISPWKCKPDFSQST